CSHIDTSPPIRGARADATSAGSGEFSIGASPEGRPRLGESPERRGRQPATRTRPPRPPTGVAAQWVCIVGVLCVAWTARELLWLARAAARQARRRGPGGGPLIDVTPRRRAFSAAAAG